METIKVIGRISEKGTEYLQTPIRDEEAIDNRFIPVYLKKSLQEEKRGKFDFISSEKKVDKAGKVYTLYTLDRQNVFFPDEDGTVSKAIIMR